MFAILLKKIIYHKKKYNLDARFWVQKALLSKNFKNNFFT